MKRKLSVVKTTFNFVVIYKNVIIFLGFLCLTKSDFCDIIIKLSDKRMTEYGFRKI